MMPMNFNTLLFFTGAIIGSILPDINFRGNKIRRKIPLWLFNKHGLITHSVFAIVVAGLVMKLNLYLGYGLFIGVCSHILGDLFTPNGCYLLYPIVKKRQSLANIKVYSNTEFKIIILLAAILITMIATMSF